MSTAPEGDSPPEKKPRLGTSAQMILALLLGVAAGIFFGERIAWAEVVGNAVILLMQMPVYPYIVVSLIGGIGSLSAEVSAMLLRRAGVVMLLLWVLGLVVILLIPLSFPSLESASFFSTSSIEPSPEIDYLKLYIPANPFESMAFGFVPAMVLFSIAMGIPLIGMEGERKREILSFMSISMDILSQITQWLIRILPIGIFAMTAAAAGTMGIAEFAHLQVYLISMLVVCALLAFWVLPWVVGSLTPVRHRELLRISRTGVITAFATGNVFIVLPVIVEECKAAMASRVALDRDSEAMIDVLVPIAYAFPTVGKFTVIVFVLFAGWFLGQPIALDAYPGLALSGLLSLFGSVYVAIPFMLNLVQLPEDVFQLFAMAGFITGRFGSVASVVNLFALTLLSVSLFLHVLKRGPTNWLRLAVGLAVGVIVVVAGTRVAMENFVESASDPSDVIANMRVGEETPTKVSRMYPVVGESEERDLADPAEIIERGVLRVGYRPSSVPFSYYNNAAELVGFDIELMAMLAGDLGVRVEFVPFRKRELADGLDRGYYDIAVSGLAMDVAEMRRVNYTDPILELNRALVARDHEVQEFSTRDRIRDRQPFTLAFVEHDDVIERAELELPKVTFEEIDSYKTFFRQKPGTYDALLISAQAGSAWTLFYPQFGVTAISREFSYPTAYAIARENPALLRFVNQWVQLKRVNGEHRRVHDYWILGRGAKGESERWSVIRDVLGWVD